MPEKVKNNKKNSKLFSVIIAVISLVVVLLLILGGAALAGRVWDPPWNPFRQNPKKDSQLKNIKTLINEKLK